MESVVIDASVVLALFDPEDALHTSAATDVRKRRAAGDDFVIPASVLAEVLVGAARLGDAEFDTRRDLTIAAFGQPHPVDEAVAVAAAKWRARHRSLRLPDALVVATADVVGADTVLTGDKRWQSLDPRIQVIG